MLGNAQSKGIQEVKIRAIDGKPVIDAKRPIKLTVNKNDVDRADVKEPADCAVARACRRELHAKEVRVHLSRVYIRSNEGNWVRYMTPKAMRSEIIAFDRGGTFSPGEFQLAAPPPNKTLGKRRGSAKPQSKKGVSGKKRRKPHVVTDVRIGPA